MSARKLIGSGVAASLLLILAAGATRAAVIETIEAVVNGTPITSGELDRYIERVGDSPSVSTEALRKQRLDELIERILLIQKAEEMGVTVEDAEVELEVKRSLDAITKSLGGQAALERSLAAIGGTMGDLEDELHEQARRDLIHGKMLSYVTSNVTVDEQDVAAFKKNRPDDFARADSVQLWQILLEIPAGADDAVVQEKERLAKEIVLQVRSGAKSFADLARDYTDGPGKAEGGYMGFVSKGVLLSVYDKAFEMGPGEVSEPIDFSLDGDRYLLIYMAGQRQTPKDFLLQERRSEAYDDYMSELKENSRIRVKTSEVASRVRPGPVDEEIENR